jgi:hypothetical protein
MFFIAFSSVGVDLRATVNWVGNRIVQTEDHPEFGYAYDPRWREEWMVSATANKTRRCDDPQSPKTPGNKLICNTLVARVKYLLQ